tara:strand:+ start:306 stop:476 length:171 start_codon:yes stop_codon:yes gene_type:complete
MGRMKDAFQDWQQLQEDMIERLIAEGHSRESAVALIQRIEDLHNSIASTNMRKEGK